MYYTRVEWDSAPTLYGYNSPRPGHIYSYSKKASCVRHAGARIGAERRSTLSCCVPQNPAPHYEYHTCTTVVYISPYSQCHSEVRCTKH